MNLHLTFKNYSTHQYACAPDYEGKVVTTVIESRSNKASASKTVLYIHGFSDYFFQEHMMTYFTDCGINFYAIDLRKCGRSFLPHQHQNYCKSMREYFPELDLGIEHILKVNAQTSIYLIGHSTGGLLISYYAKAGLLRNKVKGLLLNSPFFGFNLPFYKKLVIGMVSKRKAHKEPFSYSSGVASVYGKSLHSEYAGEWSFNLKWKPILPLPVFYAWISAVYRAQQFIQEKPNLGNLPILLLRSKVSSSKYKVTNLTTKSDVILNVKDMTKVGLKLSNQVTQVIVEDGLHDLVLSPKAIREKVLQEMKEFVLQH